MIAGCHENKEGHASVLKMFQKVQERFYWPGMFMDVQRYLKFCPECGLSTQRRSKAQIMQHIEANAPGETVVVDLLHYPKVKGHKYVLVAVDAFSRWAEVSALKDKYADTAADAIVETVFMNTTGHQTLVVSDQGSEFKGDLKAAMEILRVTQCYTAAYRSEGHGLTERFNRSLSDTLKSMVTQEDPEWHKALPWVKGLAEFVRSLKGAVA